MEKIHLFEEGKEKVQKNKGARVFGIVLGILSLLVIVAGIVVGLVLPEFVDLGGNCPTRAFISFIEKIGELDVLTIIYMAIVALLYVGAVVYGVVESIKMLLKKTKKSGNFKYLASLVLVAAVVIVSLDFYKLYGFGKIPFIAFLLSAALPLVFAFVYKCVLLFSNAKNWEKAGTKKAGLGVLALVADVIAILSFAVLLYFLFFPKFYSEKGFFKGLLTATYGGSLLSSVFAEITLISDKIAAFAQFNEIVKLLLWTVYLLAYAWLLLEVLKTVGALLVNSFRISSDTKYVRASKYFNDVNPFRSAFLLSVAQFVCCGIMIAIPLINQEVLATDLIVCGGVAVAAFIANLVLSCVYAVKVKKDKNELRLDVEVSDSDVNGIDYNKDLDLDNPDLTVVYNQDSTAEDNNEQPSTEDVVAQEEEYNVETETEPEEDWVKDLDLDEETEEKTPFVEEKTEDIVEEPIQAETVKVAAKRIENEDKNYEERVQPNANYNQPPVQPYAPPYPYAAPYPYAPPYPYAAPYPYAPAPVYQQPQPQPVQNGSPMIICLPYPMPTGGQYVQQPVQQYVQPQPQPAPQPQPQPQQAYSQPAPQSVVEDDFDDEMSVTEDIPLVIPKKTLDEKFSELKASEKKVYKSIMDYAMKKEGVKRNKGVNADVVSLGRDCIVKTQIKSGVIVCSFSLFNYEVKNLIKQEKSVKERLTVIRVVNSDAVAAVRQSIDLAYKLALEAKEARHQEQLRKRREAKRKKAEEAKK